MKWDLLLHFIVMLIVSFPFLAVNRKNLIWLAFVPPAAEIAQAFMPGRTPALNDCIHGWLGIIFSYCVIVLWSGVYPTVSRYIKAKKKGLL